MTDIEKLQKQIKQEQEGMLKEYKRLNQAGDKSNTISQACESSCQATCENFKQARCGNRREI